MLSQKELLNIESIVKECELKTDAEFVPVIFRQSDLYPAAHFRLAIFFALILPMALYYVPWTFYDPIWYLYTSMGGLILGYILGYNSTLKRIFSTRFELSEEVRQRASEYFLENGLHATKKRSAILIFVSLMEKRIEILADMNVINALSTAEKKTLFRSQVKSFSKQTKSQGLEKALGSLIRSMTSELQTHLPKKADSINELPDSVIVQGPSEEKGDVAQEVVSDVSNISETKLRDKPSEGQEDQQ